MLNAKLAMEPTVKFTRWFEKVTKKSTL